MAILANDCGCPLCLPLKLSKAPRHCGLRCMVGASDPFALGPVASAGVFGIGGWYIGSRSEGPLARELPAPAPADSADCSCPAARTCEPELRRIIELLQTVWLLRAALVASWVLISNLVTLACLHFCCCQRRRAPAARPAPEPQPPRPEATSLLARTPPAPRLELTGPVRPSDRRDGVRPHA